MDSGNSSGSMQYSSGGDEDEYDSGRAESISAFLNNPNNPSSHLGPPHHHQPPPPPPHMMAALLHSPPPPSMFDPLANFFDPLPTRPASSNAVLNLDMASWPRSPRPDCADLMQLQPALLAFNNNNQGGPGFRATTDQPDGPSRYRQLGSTSEATPNDQTAPVTSLNNNNNVPPVARNPKKRSRASRRAPTTVLTTDTTNFRAMVQEFTGIPAPPFASLPFQRTRLDLFGSGSGGLPYLFRPPFAQKQPLSAASSSSFPNPIIETLASTPSPNRNITEPGFINQNIPNPVLDFQSLFAPPGQKYPTTSPSNTLFPPKTLGSTSGILGSDDSNSGRMKTGFLEGFGQATGLPSLESSDRATLPEKSDNNNNDGNNVIRSNHIGSSQGMLTSLGGSFGQVNDRGPPGSSGTRGEGMVEPWICSSD